MPGFDARGPMGSGPMTGGARGFCDPAGPGNQKVFGRGMGFGHGSRGGYGPGMGMRRSFGRGFGRCRWYPPAYGPADTADPTTEINILKAQADAMQNTLDAINRRMAQLQKESTE